MSLDDYFYKKKLTELRPEIDREINIGAYIYERFDVDFNLAQQVARLLDKSIINDKEIHSGMYDSVIKQLIQQLTNEHVSTINDAKHILESERKIGLYSKKQPNNQTQISQQSGVQLTTEETDQFEKQKAEAVKRIKELRKSSEALLASIKSEMNIRGRKK